MKTYNDRSIKEVLGDFVGGHKRIQRGVRNVELRNIWRTAMGEMIDRYTDSIKFYDGTVTIYLSSAPLRQELSLSTKRIIEVLNEGLGQSSVQKIVLR